MGTAIDQKAYLQRYLSGPSNDKKKKKKKVVKGKGFKIIDDDLDLSKLRPLEGDELDVFGEGDDGPQIAGIIDERPEDVRKMEQFKTTTKWRVINQDDGFNSNLQIEEIKQDVKEAEKENELIFGKMYSDSEDEQKNDSDLSPPRKQANKDTKKDAPKKSHNHSDDNFSPPRRKEDKKSKSNSKKYDSHLSPQRAKQETESHPRTIYQNSDSDLSPPRKTETKKPNVKVRKPSRWGDFGNEERSRTSPGASPKRSKRDSRSPNRKRHKEKSSRRSGNYDSDVSPPRKTQRNKNNNSDSDLSPPRKSKKVDGRKRNRSPDSDLSPPRRRKGSPDKQNSDTYNRNKINDNRRKSDKQVSNMTRNIQSSRDEFRKRSKDRDFRKCDTDSDATYRNKYNNRKYTNSDSPPPTNKKMVKTLDGKQAGLQNAMQLRQENEAFRRREEEAFGQMTDDISGRNAKAVSRKAKRETSEDRQKQREKADRQKELDEKYRIWGKGLTQIQAQEQRVQEFMHEASKPLARHKDDKDLEHRLKDVEREGDPMLKYIREKKRERGELGPEKPSYKGSFPPNRFNIRPGYRWDGVDRSNGYEKKYFEQQSKRKAQEEEAYKWSTEDL